MLRTRGLSPSLPYGWQAPRKPHTHPMCLSADVFTLCITIPSPFPGHCPPQPFSSHIVPCPEARQKLITCCSAMLLCSSKKSQVAILGHSQVGSCLGQGAALPRLLQFQGCYSYRATQREVIHDRSRITCLCLSLGTEQGTV